MFFSIPTSEVLFEDPDARSRQFTSFHIHLCGTFFVSVRYSRILQLRNELLQVCNPKSLGRFPEKKLFKLNEYQLEERRVGLEAFFQQISVQPQLSALRPFQVFLRAVQLTPSTPPKRTYLPVYLPNNTRILLQCNETDFADDILEAFCRAISFPSALVYYFGLFLVDVESGDDGVLVRKVHDFEMPCKLLGRTTTKSILQFRKCYWSNSLDDYVLSKDVNDIVVTALCYQYLYDMKVGILNVSENEKLKIEELKKHSDRRALLQGFRSVSHYGTMTVKPVIFSYPLQGEEANDFPYPSIRSWRVKESKDRNCHVSFDFARAKNEIVWIDFESPFGILLSLTFQSITEEISKLRTNSQWRSPSKTMTDRTWQIVRINEAHQQLSSFPRPRGKESRQNPNTNHPQQATSSSTQTQKSASSSSTTPRIPPVSSATTSLSSPAIAASSSTTVVPSYSQTPVKTWNADAVAYWATSTALPGPIRIALEGLTGEELILLSDPVTFSTLGLSVLHAHRLKRALEQLGIN